jgi:ribosomal protein S17E
MSDEESATSATGETANVLGSLPTKTAVKRSGTKKNVKKSASSSVAATGLTANAFSGAPVSTAPAEKKKREVTKEQKDKTANSRALGAATIAQRYIEKILTEVPDLTIFSEDAIKLLTKKKLTTAYLKGLSEADQTKIDEAIAIVSEIQLKVAKELKSINAAAREVKARLNAGPKTRVAKYATPERLLREAALKRIQEFKVKPSAARITGYLTRKNSFNKKNPKNETNKGMVAAFLEGIALPDPTTAQRAKKALKNAFKTKRKAANNALRAVAPTKTVKGKTTKSVNPATVKQYAELLNAGYELSAQHMTELASLVKKGELDAVDEHPAIIGSEDPPVTGLLEQLDDKDICQRCLLATIFKIEMD